MAVNPVRDDGGRQGDVRDILQGGTQEPSCEVGKFDAVGYDSLSFPG